MNAAAVVVERSSEKSPFLLVATNVRDHWEFPNKIQEIACGSFHVGDTKKNTFMLFINGMAGIKHGIYHYGDISLEI